MPWGRAGQVELGVILCSLSLFFFKGQKKREEDKNKNKTQERKSSSRGTNPKIRESSLNKNREKCIKKKFSKKKKTFLLLAFLWNSLGLSSLLSFPTFVKSILKEEESKRKVRGKERREPPVSLPYSPEVPGASRLNKIFGGGT